MKRHVFDCEYCQYEFTTSSILKGIWMAVAHYAYHGREVIASYSPRFQFGKPTQELDPDNVRTITGEAIQIIAPEDLDNYTVSPVVEVEIRDSESVVVVDDRRVYDSSLKTSIISTLTLNHIDPPPTILAKKTEFAEGDNVSFDVEQLHPGEKIYREKANVSSQ